MNTLILDLELGAMLTERIQNQKLGFNDTIDKVSRIGQLGEAKYGLMVIWNFNERWLRMEISLVNENIPEFHNNKFHKDLKM